MTLLVDLHYLVLDADLAIEDRELWWSAEWGPVDAAWKAEDSAQDLEEIVTSVVESARRRGIPQPRIRWRLRQHPDDPSIVTALNTDGTPLPEHGSASPAA